MYIVISKPKRKVVACGVSQVIIVSFRSACGPISKPDAAAGIGVDITTGLAVVTA
jgi:hypothetical protein